MSRCGAGRCRSSRARTDSITRTSERKHRQSAGGHILSDLCRSRSAMRRLRKETPALHPAHRKLPQALCAGDKKRVWNVRANGTRQRYPTRGSRIASVHRLPPFYKPPDGSQGRLARKCAAFDKRARRAGAQAVKARPACGGRNTGPQTKG